MKLIAIIIACLIQLSAAQAQVMSGIPTAFKDTLHSEITGTDYVLYISTPYPFRSKDAQYPILFYLDAFVSSSGMNELAKNMMWSKSMDPTIVVGISFNTEISNFNNIRRRDYLPPEDDKDSTHKADDFLKFIKTELIPYMENKYGADPNDRGLLGFSYGGLFTTYAFKEDPELFQKLGLLSPSLDYRDQLIYKDGMLLNNIKNALDLDVFISYGDDESEGFKQYGQQLYEAFTANKQVEADMVLFPGEDHSTVWYASSARAMLVLCGNEYKALLREGDRFYHSEEYDKAAERYKKAFNTYPTAVRAYDRYDMACMLALSGNIDEAFVYLEGLAASNPEMHEVIKQDADLSVLREDSRWGALMENFMR
ncbi:MAG: alpha/beta hydrolase [Bacteroidia bacterium]